MGSPHDRTKVAKILAQAYASLDTREVRRLLDETARLKRGDGRLITIERDGQRAVRVHRLKHAG